MSRAFRSWFLVLVVVVFTFSLMACGGSDSDDSGGNPATYEGSTDPATADSTTAAALAEYGMGVIDAGFPLAEVFVLSQVELGGEPLSPMAPIPGYWETVVTVPVPDEAVYYGADFEGGGTLEINGTMTLALYNTTSAVADTWYIDEVELDGEIVFDEFNFDLDDPSLTGTVTIPYGLFEFSNDDVPFILSQGNFDDDPGFPLWYEVEMTFTELELSEDGDSWTLGEGDWYIEYLPETGVSLDIFSMTVGYEGKAYKLEDTNVTVLFGEGEETILVAGTEDNDNGAFYHYDLGKIWFSGFVVESESVDAITDGSITFYDAANEGTALFFVDFAYDELEGETAYHLYMNEGSFEEYGYFIDGSFEPDPGASGNFT